ncbi:arylamine N-acetyltransferase 1 [Microtus oregoni]|uniref:arylamine N-acetyltransferase 1 n=1 Tax=Microtus oregoni TaxID=111838 RepID=UPI001BB1DEB0|nr:arylamine N-acetyltransferase 1 [Microtus oregoni]XP_041531196.1 arylamine N-acetyltransferase 1 [Microtus oregoni]XP_041531197.1 arylamine N-acetyltransferase 1 [Microtus oregoni]XP_041531198.1 arylamine N-acetyltransferase 1 [Microtus oregoni]XP_041531199.1 arylamine N-acetyltransferase 1 [Microtus oregoni]XP_041531200.1 arylamine N-acetyltransferase 1 [Microtus oregoni]
MDIAAYFERIGYENSVNKLDLDTLTEVLQHQMRTVPFENLSMHCGEPMNMDLETTFDHIVRKKRGGWCLQVNHLLYWALTKMGFETTMLGGYVYIVPVNKYSKEMIHLLVQVTISDRNYIVDAAFGGSCQMWEPLELASGKDQPQVPAIFRLTEENGTWYLDQIRREQYIPNQEFVNSDLLEKSEYRKVYSFTLKPRTIEDFEYVNTYLQTSSTSVFVHTSFCSLQTPEGVCCLIGSTFASRKFSYKDNVDLVEFKNVNEEEIEDVLKAAFGVSLERKLVPKNGDLSFTI